MTVTPFPWSRVSAATLGPFTNYLFGVSSVFAGGDAANIVTNLDDAPPDKDEKNGRLCLAEKPKGRLLFWTFESLAPQPNEVRPLAFGTDTTLGLKLAWSGLTAQFPDTRRPLTGAMARSLR